MKNLDKTTFKFDIEEQLQQEDQLNYESSQKIFENDEYVERQTCSKADKSIKG